MKTLDYDKSPRFMGFFHESPVSIRYGVISGPLIGATLRAEKKMKAENKADIPSALTDIIRGIKGLVTIVREIRK